MRQSGCQAPPTSLPPPRPWLRLSRWRQAVPGVPGARGRGPGARGPPGEGPAGAVVCLSLTLSLSPGPEEGDRRTRGWAGGRAWGNFPPFSCIPLRGNPRRSTGRFPRGVQAPVALCALCFLQPWLRMHARPRRWRSPQTHTQPPRPSPSARAPPAAVISREQGGHAAGERGDGPARPYLRGQPGARAPSQSPRSRRPRPSPQTSSLHSHHGRKHPLAGAEQLVAGWHKSPRAGGAYPVRSAGRTRSFSAPRPSFCGGAAAGTRAGPWPARPASPPWTAAAGRAAGWGDQRALTFPWRSRRDSGRARFPAPGPKTNKWPLCTAEPLPKTPFLCFWPKPRKAEKSQNLEEEEGKKRGKGEGEVRNV